MNSQALIAARTSFLLKSTFLVLVSFLLFSCLSTQPISPLLRAEPAINSSLNRAPRTLRLYYESLPDVSQSSLRLVGPEGELSLRGLHTMAADDLMIEILDPVTPGQYTVYWTTVVANDNEIHQGSYDFSYAPDS
ncbi:MAG: copper resistance protein CopC [Pseudomonadales bacterium]